MDSRKQNLTTPAGKLFNMSIKSMGLLNRKEEISENGKIEVILFCTIVTMFFLHNKNQDLFQKVQLEFEELVLQNLHDLGLDKKIPNLFDFLNIRTFHITNDVKRLFGNDTNWLPLRIYRWFYTNPLSLDEESSDDDDIDMFNVMEFHWNLMEIVGEINDGVKSIEKEFDNLTTEVSKTSERPSVQLINMVIESAKLIEEEEKLTNNGKVEVILFNANLARLHLHAKSPRFFQKIGQEFDNLVLQYLISLGLNKQIADVSSFLNARTIALNKEIQAMSSGEGWIPVNIYDWFFVNPLVLNSKPKIDLLNLMAFQMLLSSMMGSVKEGVDLIIKQ